ncbi:MAG TPA: hypothetical protein V6D19_20035 [Stenomitos sp.]
MSPPSSKKTSAIAWQQYWGIGVPLLFFGIVACIIPIAQVFEFDRDEGIELVKVALMHQGYVLYDQIWDDQPPVLTLLLQVWLNFFGSSVLAARLLTLSLASLLVGAFFNSLRLVVGLRPALIGTMGLCLTLNFVRLSVSVMRGLPALALAMGAIYLLVWVTQPRSSTALTARSPYFGVQPWQTYVGILSSGCCFGLSLQTKFYTALLLPACLVQIGLGWGGWRWPLKNRTERIGLMSLWLITCAATTLTIGLFTHAFHWEQLFGAHFDGATQKALQGQPSWQVLLIFLVQDIDAVLLAGFGTWTLLRQRRQWPILPLVWLICVVVGLLSYRPLWYHYYPLISVPIMWLAVYGLSQFQPNGSQPWYRHLLQGVRAKSAFSRWLARAILLAIALVPIKLAVVSVSPWFYVQDSPPKFATVQHLKTFAPATRWLFTDLPMYAFYAGLNVPPELAVFSTKRIESGNLSPKVMQQLLATYRPEQIALSRDRNLAPQLEPYLSQHYALHYKNDTIAQYLRRNRFLSVPSVAP